MRQAAPRPGRARPPAGLVEVDETEIPCRAKDDPPTGAGGRSGQGKLLIAGAVEVRPGAPTRLRLAAIEDFSASSLHAVLAADLASGATAKTDGWSGYPGAPGVHHEPHVIGPMAAHVVLPWVHRAFANLKTWALVDRHCRKWTPPEPSPTTSIPQPPTATAVTARVGMKAGDACLCGQLPHLHRAVV